MHLRKRIGTGLVLLVFGLALAGSLAVIAAAQGRGGGAAAPAAQGRGGGAAAPAGGGGGRGPVPGTPTDLATVTTPAAAAQMKEDAANMQLVGFNDLQGRSAYQPTLHQQGNRWIAYIGFHGGSAVNPMNGQMEQNGTMIIDVTDPKQPKTLINLPGEPGATPQAGGNGAQMVRVCDGSTLPRADRTKVYMLRTYGNTAHETWDVTDPAKPVKLATVVSGLRDTHKNFWECDTGIAYLVSGVADWRTMRMTQIFDLSDPAKPVFIRNFGVTGQQPGSTGPVPTELHGAISMGANINRVYMGYGTGANGIIQILDRAKLLNGPKEPTEANLKFPIIAQIDLPPDIGSHTAFPLLGMQLPEFTKQKPRAAAAGAGTEAAHASDGPPPEPSQSRRDFIISVGETTGSECQENRQMMRVVDITNEARPFGVASYTVQENSGNFCNRGGRFGSHSVNENMTPFYHRRILFLTEFNAGVRAIDIRDPLDPKEIGHYIPAVTAKTDRRCVGQGPATTCKIAIQTNNAEVDGRGYIYIVDRANTGMHILQLTGTARAVANGLPNLPN
jgi:hypothetical protein